MKNGKKMNGGGMWMLSCKMMGMDCPWQMSSENKDEVAMAAGKHAMETHGMSQADVDGMKGKMMGMMKQM